MRVLLLTHYFEPENGPSQRRWSALIERFVAAGHIVDVVAPPPHNRTGKIDPDAPAAALRGRTAVGSHGGTVHRVSFLQHTGGVASRTLDHLWVARGSVRAVRRLVRDGRLNPDIVVATAPALPSLIAGRTVARMLHIPLVVEMRDAWPDLVSHTPGLTRGKRVVTRLKRRVHEFVTALQRSAALVVTTTETFARVLRERDVATVAVIRNGTSLRRYAGIPPTEHGHDELRVLYMGTIGRSQGLEVLIRATQRARQRGVDVRTRIVGHGADVRRLVALNEALGSPVELLPHVAADEVFGHYTWADTTVVSLRDWEPFQWTVPSKLYELMATGKHVTAAVAGEAAELVRQSCSGDVVAPGDVEGIAELWVQLAADRARVASRDGGRSWVAANVDYDVIAKRYLQVIQEALANFTAARHPRS